MSRTPDESSLVVPETSVSLETGCESGWRCLKVESPFECDLSGMTTSIAAPVAGRDIDEFAVATQDSDYLLIRGKDLDLVISTLTQRGLRIEFQRG